MRPTPGAQPLAGTRQPTQVRHDQIVAAAARLFAERGFSGVGIDDIGTELGISGPALYRHVSGKDAVLAEIVGGLMGDLAVVSRAVAGEADDPAGTLRQMTAAAVDLCLDRHAEVTVTLRSAWQVQGEFSDEVLSRWTEVTRIWACPLRRAHPGLDAADSSLYLRVGAGLVTAVARVPQATAHVRLVGLVTEMLSALLTIELTHAGPEDRDESEPAASAGWTRSSRREQILDAAITLFREQGFRGVSMREIGDAVGASASASYRHFKSKEDILATAITRVGERLTAGLSDALSEAASAQDALDRLLRSYIAICVQNHELIAVATSEAHHLPAEQLREYRRHQRLLNDEWAHCLATVRPGLSAAEVKVYVLAVLGMVREATRSRRMERRAHLEEDLFRLARAAIYA